MALEFAETLAFARDHIRISIGNELFVRKLAGMRFLVPMSCAAYGATIRDQRHRKHEGAGRPMHTNELRARVSSWPPLRLARLRRERESVVVVSPAVPL